MSDSPPNPDTDSDANPVSSPAPPKEKSPLLRQLTLIAFLGLMIGALYYDRQIARPFSQAKSEELQDVARGRLYDEKARSQLTPAEVAEILGKQAATSEETDHYLKETYRWMAGMPFRSYYVVAVYTKSRGEPQYTFSMYNDQPPDSMMPGFVPPPNEFDPPPTPRDLQGVGPGSPDPTQGSPDPTRGSPDPTRGSPDPTQGSPDPTQGSPDPTQGSPDPTQGSPESADSPGQPSTP